MNSMGMKASTKAMGACAPTAMTTSPRVAAREKSGAVEATPITVEPRSPSFPGASPLGATVPGAGVGSATGRSAISFLVPFASRM
ncbi:hypothetical protein GCM10009648_16980 [Tsukamurella spumae]